MSTQNTNSSIDQASEKLNQILSKEYDNLVHLVQTLKEEQKLIVDRKTRDLTDLLPRIQQELRALQLLQQQREEILRKNFSSPPSQNTPGIAARIFRLPEAVKEKCLKLSRKVETEMQVMHEIGWQNQILLSRAVEFLQEVLSPLIGPRKTETLSIYGQHGKLQADSTRQAIFQGVG